MVLDQFEDRLDLVVEEATDHVGAEMERAIEQSRERLAETPVASVAVLRPPSFDRPSK